MSLPLVLLLAALLATLWLVRRIRQRPPFPGRGSFLAMQLAAAWWSGCAGLEIMAETPGAKLFWAEMAWAGIIAAPGFWAIFLRSYVQGGVGPRWSWGALGLAGLGWAVALTNDWHHLIYLSARPVADIPGAALDYRHGPGFFAITAYLYLAMLATVVIALQAILRAPALYRWHYAGLLAAVALPWLANIAYVTDAARLFDFDPTPFSFVVMGGIFHWLISRRFFDLLPVARDTLLDGSPDPVLVADADGLILDANPAARRLPGMPDRPVGRRLHAAPLLRGVLHRLHLAGEERRAELLIEAAGRHYEVEAVPLTHGERRAGRLLLLRDVTRRVQAETRLQEALAALRTQLEANLQLQQQLREQAVRDPLTGLHNRRLFEQTKPLLLAEAERSGKPMAAVMLDLDHFKRLNDTHGHQAGDAVLQRFAAVLLRSTRPGDGVFRLGGEEFLVLLPGLCPRQAQSCAEGWRAMLDREVSGLEIGRVTFSAGIAGYPADAAGWEDLLRRADTALYAAKLTGRARSCRWEEVRPQPLPARPFRATA